jgi:hypothetical protein
MRILIDCTRAVSRAWAGTGSPAIGEEQMPSASKSRSLGPLNISLSPACASPRNSTTDRSACSVPVDRPSKPRQKNFWNGTTQGRNVWAGNGVCGCPWLRWSGLCPTSWPWRCVIAGDAYAYEGQLATTSPSEYPSRIANTITNKSVCRHVTSHASFAEGVGTVTDRQPGGTAAVLTQIR